MKTLAHGGTLDAAIAEFGGKRPEWLDLSTGISPRSWPIPEIEQRFFTRLPEQGDLDRAEMAARKAYGVADAMAVVAVAGSQTAIEFLPRILPGKSATILTSGHGTYGEHAHCCAKAGRTVREIVDPGEIRPDETLAVLVHPNNPDGKLSKREKIFRLARLLGGNGGHVIVDEAFGDSLPAHSFLAGQPDNVIVLRSLGKFFGLAGIRAGFVICAPTIAARIRTFLGPWPISGPAIAIAAQALADRDWIASSQKWQVGQSAELEKLLAGQGLRITGRHPLFVLASHECATAIARGLAHRHIAVRRFADRPQLLRFGLPANAEEMMRLRRALAQSTEPVVS
jgi:cobalamin biosynthesis protein CobC